MDWLTIVISSCFLVCVYLLGFAHGRRAGDRKAKERMETVNRLNATIGKMEGK